jgi:hypothetical protein
MSMCRLVPPDTNAKTSISTGWYYYWEVVLYYDPVQKDPSRVNSKEKHLLSTTDLLCR